MSNYDDEYVKSIEKENESLRSRNEILSLAVDKFVRGRFLLDAMMFRTEDKIQYSARYSCVDTYQSIILDKSEADTLVREEILKEPRINEAYINAIGESSDIPAEWLAPLKAAYAKQEAILNKQEEEAKKEIEKQKIIVVDET